MNNFDFEPLEPLPMRPEQEREDKEICSPKWHCFCCRDTGKVQPDLVRQVIPSYNDDRDRLPICQNCNKGHEWYHLDDLGILDMRLNPQICGKLDAYAREDWRRTTQMWFEMAKERVEKATQEIAQKGNLRKRDRIQAEFILVQEKHGKERGDWEEIEEEEVEGELC